AIPTAPPNTRTASTIIRTACLGGLALAAASAWAQGSARARPQSMPSAQLSAPDLVLRIDRLEEEIRRLTGLVEQLQYRNQQLEQQLRRAQGASGPAVPGEAQARWREPEPGAPAAPAAPPPASGMPAPSAALEPALPRAAG